MVSANPLHQLVSSNDVEGTNVFGANSEKIGEIDHLIIDKVSGQIGYAVMSFGGFLGLGHGHYPIPWSTLTYDPALEGFRTSVTESQLKDSPEYSDDSWDNPDWEKRLHKYYSAVPYWGM